MMKIIAMLGVLWAVSVTATTVEPEVITHAGESDPSTEGFALSSCCGSILANGPLPDDLGRRAWALSSTSIDGQITWSSALTRRQQADIINAGFSLTIFARAVQNNAPAYEENSPTPFMFVALDTGQRRFGVFLGLDAQGDTVAVLEQQTAPGGPGGSLLTFGPAFSLPGSGSTYHRFDLVQDRGAQLADFYIDGTKRLSGYGGTSPIVGGAGFSFGAFNGGQGNFNFAQMYSPVPVPAPLFLLAAPLLVCYGFARRRFDRASA
jgi:hypothetical protein